MGPPTLTQEQASLGQAAVVEPVSRAALVAQVEAVPVVDGEIVAQPEPLTRAAAVVVEGLTQMVLVALAVRVLSS